MWMRSSGVDRWRVMISGFKALLTAMVLWMGVAFVAGCNDTLRQFIITVPKPGGNPALPGNAVVLSTNPAGVGSNLHLDVSGDDIAAVVNVGTNPVFLGKAGGTVFVINGDNTISSYLALTALGVTVHTGVMPATTSGPVAGGTSSSSNILLADSGSNDVSVVNSGLGAVTQVVPVGARPVAVAGNAANSKAYVVNHDDNTVTVVFTVDNSVGKTIPVGAQPIWAVMSADGVDVFVVNQGDGTVSVIDTTLDQVIPCAPGPSCNPATHAISVGLNPATAAPNFAYFEPNRERLYVSNTGENTVSVIKADGINLGTGVLPGLLANVPVSGTPVSVAALNDGTKAYAALGNCPSGTNHTNLSANLASCNGNLVSVIDAVALRETKTIAMGPGVVSVDASGDASRAYSVSAHDTTTIVDNVHNPSCAAAPCPAGGNCLKNCQPGPIQAPQTFITPSVSIIRTATDTVFLQATPIDPSETVSTFSYRVPNQDPKCVPAINGSFNQTVPIPCPTQEPLMVRTVP
jgi:YVTN family beta-propeller protein